MIYFINFPERVDKYDNVMNMFSKLGITNYKCIVPVDPSVDFGNNNILSDTAKSTKLTHMKCCEDAVENNYQKIVIFEDDFCFNQEILAEENIEYHLKVIFTFLNDVKWNVFYFDNIRESVKKDNKMISFIRDKHKFFTPFYKISGKRYVHSYALSNDACHKLIETHNSNTLWNDQSIEIMKIDGKYLYLPGLFDQILDLETDHLWNNT